VKPAPIDRLLAGLDRGKGERVVCLGVTGMGKSYALRALGAAAAARVDILYVLDDTDDSPRWGGQRRIDLDDCAAKPLVSRAEGGSHIVVLTGEPFSRRVPNPEAVAVDAWALAQRGATCAIVIDELRRATDTPKQWSVPGGDLPRAFSEGRKVGISVLAATNFPQEVPRESLGSSHLVIFRLGGGESSYLRQRRWVDWDMADEIDKLPPRECLIRWLGELPDFERYKF